MHTTVLVLGMLLILSELGAIGFMLVNAIHSFREPQMAVHLAPVKKASESRLKVTVIENRKATTTVIAMPQQKPSTKHPARAGYFSLVP